MLANTSAWGAELPLPAQDAPAFEVPPAAVVDPTPLLRDLQDQLEALRTRQTAADGELSITQQDLADAALVVNPAAEAAARPAAMDRLVASSGDGALPFLHAAVRDPHPPIAIAAVAHLGSLDTPAATRVARLVLSDPQLRESLRATAITALVAQATPAAGDALYAAAEDQAVPGDLRRAALAALDAGWPELLAARGRPSTGTNLWGAVVGTIGNGVAGGVILSSVGTWGQSSAATAIGAVGGGAIGAGTGLVYALTEPVSLGQGLRYTSSVGWGLTGAQLLNTTWLGPRYDPSRGQADAERRDNIGALNRTVLTAAGAVQGAVWMGRDPQAHDVGESNLAGYLGAQIGAGVVDLAIGNSGSCTDLERAGVWQTDCSGLVRWERARAGAALGGAAGGLGLAALTRDTWAPGGVDLAFSTVVATELGVVGAALPAAIGVRVDHGNFRTAFHAGAALGLAAAHPLDLELQSPALGLWGGALGNALGAGVPLLLGTTNNSRILWPMIGVGLGGTGAGLIWGPALDLGSGDVAMTGIGVSIATLEGAAIGGVLQAYRPAWTSRQTGGLTLTAGAATGVGLTLLSQRASPRPANMFFLGSAAAWGTWYGFLTPIGLKLEGTSADALLATTLVGDAFLVAGGVLVTPRLVGLDPRDTMLAQLGGVTGATLGALTAAMTTDQSDRVALGAVIGSAVGMVGGGVTTALLRSNDVALRLPMGPGRVRLPDLPGTWTPSVAPTTLEDGSTGLAVALRVSGL